MLPVLAWADNLLAHRLRRVPAVAAAPAPTWPLGRPNLAQLAQPTAVLPALVAHDAVGVSTSPCSARSIGRTSPNAQPTGRGPAPPRRPAPPTSRPSS
jgi:hypothetical protein